MGLERPRRMRARGSPVQDMMDIGDRGGVALGHRLRLPASVPMLLPWTAAASLLALCAAYGVATVSGLRLPPDLDALRDVGFAQGMLDGNWFGDPMYPAEWRFYPPLIPALRALLFRLTGGTDLLAHWIQTSPWLNLLPPLAFFFMARRLFGSAGVAATALASFVLLSSNIRWGFFTVTGGYTPWPAVPVSAQAFFFATVWLIHARVEAARWRDAAAIGAAIGATFLAHVIPAVVLTGIVAAAAFAAQGARPRTAGWLAVVAAVQLAVMSPYLLPILLHYPDGTVHTGYQWVHGLFTLGPGNLVRLAILNAPGAAAAFVIWRLRRRVAMGRLTTVILATWIAVPLAFLLRHYACAIAAPSGVGADAPAACRAFVVSIHHYHLYLQLAWPCLIGFAAWHAARLWLTVEGSAAAGSPRSRRVAAVVAAASLASLVGAFVMFHRRGDELWREAALLHADRHSLDFAAYRWILVHTGPDDAFVTIHDEPREGPEAGGPVFAGPGLGGPEAFTVIAAGRQLVSGPEFFSHPYVPWAPREARRLRYLAAARGEAAVAGGGGLPCHAVEGGLWFLLPNATAVDSSRVEPLFRSATRTLYRALPAACVADPGEDVPREVAPPPRRPAAL